MAFKLKGMSHGEGTGSAYKNVGYTGYGPKSAAFQKTKGKTDKKIINSLKNELMAMKDPMESNRGKNIVKKLRALGADPENFM
jgi:hypothetical protein